MANIQDYLNQIKNAIYGKDVRQAIHDGIEQCYKDGRAGAIDLVARQEIAGIVAPTGEAPSTEEVLDARVGADTVIYQSLGLANRTQFANLTKVVKKSDADLYIPDLELVAQDKRFTVSNGRIVMENMSTARVYRMSSNNVSKLSVTMNSSFTQWFYVAAVADANGNVKADSKGRNRYLIRKTTDDDIYNSAEFTPLSGGYVYVNLFGDESNPYYNTFSCINYEKVSEAYRPEIREIADSSMAVATLKGQVNNTMVVQTISDLELVALNKRFEVSNGQISFVNATAIAVYRMPSDNVRKISITTKDASEGGWLYGAAVADANGNVSNERILMFNGIQTYTIEFTPVNGGYVYVNLWGYSVVPNRWYDDISFINYDSIGEISRYHTMVRKPFAWSGKRINFTGDSITKGYINGQQISQNYNYPKLFCDAVGATPYNLAVGGATFSTGTQQSHIIDQVTNTNKNNDILFIAAGINDWAFGVDLATFATAVKQVCDYLNNASNGWQTKPVIWITPINQGGWEDTHEVDQKGTVFDYSWTSNSS